MREFGAEVPNYRTTNPSHFVAIYTYRSGQWTKLAGMSLDVGEQTSANSVSPDYLDKDKAVKQIQIDPSRTWLEVSGGAGAHGGTYEVLSYDGTSLRMEFSALGVSPGFGRMQDVNGDGTLDVVADVSDRYVFCYACGVTEVRFRVLSWDKQSQSFKDIGIQTLTEGEKSGPISEKVQWSCSRILPAGRIREQLNTTGAGRHKGFRRSPRIAANFILGGASTRDRQGYLGGKRLLVKAVFVEKST